MSITKIIYLLYGAGIFLWQYPLFYWIYTAFRSRFFIRRNLRKFTEGEELKKLGAVSLHIKMLIEGSEAGKIFSGPESFYLISGTLGLGTAFIVSLAEGPVLALICGLFMGVMPYCLLQLRLYRQRVTRSREGDTLVQELLNNYKIHDYNMKEAVEITAYSLEGAPEERSFSISYPEGCIRQ